MRVYLHPDALEPSALAAVQRDALAISHAPNFWVPRAQLEAGASACRSAADAAVLQLLERHMRRRLPPDWAGAEYWCQVYAPGKGLEFHFDKDEALLVAEGRMSHPAWSSVLYLTGSCAAGARREGPTVIIDQVFDQALGRPDPEDPESSCLVYPVEGAYCVFDGRLGHGVLDSFSAARRATLLVNWWTHQPQAVHVATDEELQKHGIPLISSDDGGEGGGGGGGGVGGGGGGGGAAEQLAGLKVSGPPQQQGADSANSGAGGAGGGRSGGPEPRGPRGGGGGAAAARAARDPADGDLIPEVAAPGAAALDHAVPVDELIEAAGLSLAGAGAVSAVRVRHPGLVLLPLDPEQTRQAEGGGGAAGAGAGAGPGPGLQTAAALVPAALLEGSDEEEDGEEEADEENGGGVR